MYPEGDEDEDVGCVAEAVVPRCEPRNGVIGNVVQEDRPVGEPPEQIEAQIPAAGRAGRRAHGGVGVAVACGGYAHHFVHFAGLGRRSGARAATVLPMTIPTFACRFAYLNQM